MLLSCSGIRCALPCTLLQTPALLLRVTQCLPPFHQQYVSQTFHPVSIAPALQDLVTTGRLKQDDSQRFAAKALNTLQTAVTLEAQTPSPQANSSSSAQLANQTSSSSLLQLPRGAYLWGTIGSGKTMLLDLFCSTFPISDRQQLGLCRLHFHEFMLTIHSRLHSLQESVPRIKGHSQFGLPVYRYAPLNGHPVDLVAQSIARDTRVLCLDELHVTDVADALILGQLFSALLREGTVVVFTSNKPPLELYKNGLNRQYFLPFVKLVQKQLAVIEVSAASDYRLQDQALGEVLAMPGLRNTDAQRKEGQQGVMLVGPGSHDALDVMWGETAGSLQTEATLNVGFGRMLHVPKQLSQGQQASRSSSSNSSTPGPAAMLDFEQVCGQQGLAPGLDQGGALGPADMVALAAAYPLLFIQGIPVLQWSQRNEARRLVTLIDTLYDMRCRLECSAAGKPRQIFAELLDHARRLGIATTSGLSSASAKLEQAEATAADLHSGLRHGLAENSEDEEPVSLALLQEEVVMYGRAISRLSEMCRLQPA
ncbi:hypothetical protein ABBQ32_009199 [Trebouxia sp. C0010 RCD-2024]